MGILNATPDSFSDGGKYFDAEAALKKAEEMMKQGADIIDLGGQSTRPGSEAVSPSIEWERIKNIAAGLTLRNIPFSVDTFYPEVARKALEAGALMINDVSGNAQKEMAEAIKEYGAAWVLMSRKGEAKEIAADLKSLAEDAMSFGIAKEQICLDPGIGFGKSNEQSIDALKQTANLKPEGFGYLVGASRKRCIGFISGIENPEERDEATAEIHSIAIEGGADIIRVHNVALAKEKALEDDKKFRS